MASVVGGDGVSAEDWEQAMALLSSLINSKRRGDGADWGHAFDMMAGYLESLGLGKELPRLSVIHVAGTKGKGSTCAMIESVLRACGYRTGLYTSPHLVDVRERIRLGGQPVDRATFVRHLRATYNTLATGQGEGASMAAYFRFLTLLGFKIFLEAGVDVAVLEVGIGGRLDATNCVRSPVACGVSPLGYDHMDLLGSTLGHIATEKAGIFKPGVPAFTVQQPEEALAALRKKAGEVGAPLAVVRPWEGYANSGGVRLGLAGEHQKTNAALALALVGAWEAAAGRGPAAGVRAAALAAGTIPAEYAAGLEAAAWPGRGQIVHDYEAAEPGSSGAGTGSDAADAAAAAAGASATSAAGPAKGHHRQQPQQPHQWQRQGQRQMPRLTFYLDGAHTPESMLTCGQWFADAVGTPGSGGQAEGSGSGSNGRAAGSGANGTSGSSEQAAGASAAAADDDNLVTQRVLLFNCMQEREPAKLLAPLAATLAERRVPVHHALFVPPDSQYSKVGAGPGDAPVDLSWQHSLRAVWEGLAPAARVAVEASARVPLPPLPSVAVPPGAPAAAAGAPASSSAVLPSLRVTLDWLRRCVRETPTLRMQVLVTGSLYVVGDMLRLLGNPQPSQQQKQSAQQQHQQAE